ncbi:MAG: hypothetical protein ACYSUX_16925, partial [Planctomycetota bacterium]
MCKKLIYWASLVLVLGLSAGVASGDVFVLLDAEGSDTNDMMEYWPNEPSIVADAPKGSANSYIWTTDPGEGGGEIVPIWDPPLDLSAYSYFNFY